MKNKKRRNMAIVRMRERGDSFGDIAKKYKLSKSTITEIYYREMYHVEDMPMPKYIAKKVLKKLSTV